jgi:Tol biopolymer transport system component
MKALSILLLMCAALAVFSSVDAAENPWKVVAVREPKHHEITFEEKTHYLRPGQWEERNTVAGPGHLVAYVRTDRHHHPYLQIEDRQSGEDSVFVYPSVSLPCWSPDGSYLSVSLWTPQTRMGKLVVFDVATWKTVIDVDLASAASAKWSPDSRRIASDGVSYKTGQIVFFEVSVPGGAVSVLDSTNVMGDAEFSWSPDSRWIVYSKPTKVHHVGDTIVSDLCVADAATGDVWSLVKGTDHNQSSPLWITDNTIQVDRIWWDEDDDANWTNREQRVVLVLKRVQ